jgi:hypothetical protein
MKRLSLAKLLRLTKMLSGCKKARLMDFEADLRSLLHVAQGLQLPQTSRRSASNGQRTRLSRQPCWILSKTDRRAGSGVRIVAIMQTAEEVHRNDGMIVIAKKGGPSFSRLGFGCFF